MTKKSIRHNAGKELHHLFRQIFQLQAALSAIMDAVHAQAGLTTSQLRVMRSLSESGTATVPDIATELGVSRQFVQNDFSTTSFYSATTVELGV